MARTQHLPLYSAAYVFLREIYKIRLKLPKLLKHDDLPPIFDLLGNCMEGDFGKRAEKLVKEWCKERQKELDLAWKRAMEGKETPWVPPLQ